MAQRRFEYDRMTAERFNEFLANLDITVASFARIFGMNLTTVTRWSQGTQDIPPWVTVVARILKESPGAIVIARNAAAEMISADNAHPERNPYPYLTRERTE